MPDASDRDLLQAYSQNGSETAFAGLVQRHINLVYSVALRQVGLPAHAEEITQAVFVILARKAASLSADILLEGWLYETTRFTSLTFIRGERRRQSREQEAYMRSTLHEPGDDALWNQLSPLLDQAMAGLGKKDREAVILRFFKGQSVREVAATLQVNEAAAQRRILRALEKIRKSFLRRGVNSTTAIIAGAIAVNSVQAAPSALAKTATAVAVAKGAAASASTVTLIKGALKFMAWQKAKMAIVAGVIALLVAGTGVVGSKLLRADDAGISFEAEGTLVYETSPARTDYIDTKHFTLIRQGKLWKIRTTNLEEERNGVVTRSDDRFESYFEMSFDGTNIYDLKASNPQKVIPMFPADAVRSGKYILAEGRIEHHDSPPYLDAGQRYPIWLAYCSRPYFKSLKDDQAVPPTFGERDFLNERSVPMKSPAKWNMEGKFMKDVSWICDGTFIGYLGGGKTVVAKYQPPYDKPYIDQRFETLSWTNWNGISVPSSFKIVTYYPDYPSNGVPHLEIAYSIKGTLESLRSAGKFSPTPEITTRTAISDFRGPRGRNDYNSYIRTNDWNITRTGR